MDVSVRDEIYFPGMHVYRDDKAISDLIRLLNSEGVKIEEKDCFKLIDYRFMQEIGESLVPFLLPVEGHATVKSYVLRRPNLEIGVEGHSEHHGSGLPGVIGSRLVSTGTRFDIRFDGGRGGEEMVEKVGNVLIAKYKYTS